MSFFKDRLRASLVFILDRVGLLETVRRLMRFLTNPELRRRELELRRREQAHRQRFLKFKRQYGSVLRHNLNGASNEQKRALVFSIGLSEGMIEVELGVIKALELAGFVPSVLINDKEFSLSDQEIILEYHNLATVKEVHSWSKFVAPRDYTAAEAVVERCQSVQELLEFEYAGARVGRFAVATALRGLKSGSLDLQSAQNRRMLVECIARGLTCAIASQKILRKFRPELLLIQDWVYSPLGEIYDICLANGIDVITWDAAHKSNSLMFKRYTLENSNEHYASLSAESWRLVRSIEWTDAHRDQLQRELYNTYASGDWFSVCGTQFNKRLIAADEIRTKLGLDPAKKNVFIFPHITWDASFFYGEDLFSNYEDWFIETVRAACADDHVNWVIKIHPAHAGKGVREHFQGEPSEVIALRKHIDALPPHIFLIPADSEISTFSLFELMDYCLTVRGTVGLEAARLGIPVLTAGTGCYSHKGFTIDSESRDQYLERVTHIQEIPRLSLTQQELAERYAYAIFVLRPLPLTTVTLQYHKDHDEGSSKTQINIRTKEEWYNSPDLTALAQWMADASQQDFLMPFPERQCPPVP